jgi:hypothetical protein
MGDKRGTEIVHQNSRQISSGEDAPALHLAAVRRSAAVETPGRPIPTASRAAAREVKKNPILPS